jgi:hypothetical protein
MYAIWNVLHHIAAYENGGGVALSNGDAAEARFVNNTIYKCAKGVYVRLDDSDLADITRTTIVNNIFLYPLSDDWDGSYDVNIEPAAMDACGLSGCVLTLDYDLAYPSGTVDFIVTGYSGGHHSSLSNLCNASPSHGCTSYCTVGTYECNGKDTNPSLSNPTALNFHPTGGGSNPCHNAGVYDDSFDVFNYTFDDTDFGTILHDFDNVSIMSGYYAYVPIGAYKP